MLAIGLLIFAVISGVVGWELRGMWEEKNREDMESL